MPRNRRRRRPHLADGGAELDVSLFRCSPTELSKAQDGDLLLRKLSTRVAKGMVICRLALVITFWTNVRAN